ncbi:MAG: UDP-2,3-diacylglucosamine diphosphatase [Burkholderiaceae bacterium]
MTSIPDKDAPTAGASLGKAVQKRGLALFASDLHLHPSLPKTVDAFFSFLEKHACHARQLYLLGDLFEYWAGDDDLSTPFNRKVASELCRAADAGIDIFWVAGNRDFLIGEEFASKAKLSLLPDPFVTRIATHRIVLTHGDLLCTDDVSYMKFREQVRNPIWQNVFLAKPLEERKSIIEGMRSGSKEAQRMKAADIMDTNAAAVTELFRSTEASIMIHGHTHRPARHSLVVDDKERLRFVLPDWDCDVATPRGGWISIDEAGKIRTYNVTGQEIV